MVSDTEIKKSKRGEPKGILNRIFPSKFTSVYTPHTDYTPDFLPSRKRKPSLSSSPAESLSPISSLHGYDQDPALLKSTACTSSTKAFFNEHLPSEKPSACSLILPSFSKIPSSVFSSTPPQPHFFENLFRYRCVGNWGLFLWCTVQLAFLLACLSWLIINIIFIYNSFYFPDSSFSFSSYFLSSSPKALESSPNFNSEEDLNNNYRYETDNNHLKSFVAEYAKNKNKSIDFDDFKSRFDELFNKYDSNNYGIAVVDADSNISEEIIRKTSHISSQKNSNNNGNNDKNSSTNKDATQSHFQHEKFSKDGDSLYMNLKKQYAQKRKKKNDLTDNDSDDIFFQFKSASPSSTISRMHGNIGKHPDGSPGWTPSSPPRNQKMQKALQEGGGFNMALSDSMNLDRDVADSRHPSCKLQKYKKHELLKASVIIVFYNEPFSTLMRSVHSVLNRTPPDLLEEIILVDDGSTVDHIREDGNQMLVKYVNLLPKCRLVRNMEREGIVSARLRGIRESRSEIFVILDSHIEVQIGWLEPLSNRLFHHPTHVVMPQIDGIDAETFEVAGGGIGCKLGFLWKLMEHSYEFHQMDRFNQKREKIKKYQEQKMLEKKQKAQKNENASDDDYSSLVGDTYVVYNGVFHNLEEAPTDFQSSPTMAGGLFAANKDFFMDIGGYDEGFKFWGTENLELSFRLWQCGGVLECAPCSRVYHIFRKGGVGYSSPADSVVINKMRTLIWMEEYADLAWRVSGKPIVEYDMASLKKRIMFKNKKKCNSFRWFLENIFPESDVIHLTDVPYLGRMQNKKTKMCLDNLGNPHPGGKVSIHECNAGDNQEFMYFRRIGHIMPVANDEACLEPSSNLDWCRASPKYWWEVTEKGQIRHKKTNQCLTIEDNDVLSVKLCNDDDDAQVWDWNVYNPPSHFLFPPTRRS